MNVVKAFALAAVLLAGVVTFRLLPPTETADDVARKAAVGLVVGLAAALTGGTLGAVLVKAGVVKAK